MITKIYNYLKERTYLVVAGIVVMTLITLFLTLMPADQILPDKVWTFDKLGHMIIFGGWAFLVGWYRLLTKPQEMNLFTIFFLGILFGASVEVLQYLMPFKRSANFFDIAFDALGSFVAILALYSIKDSIQFAPPENVETTDEL